MFSAAQLHIDGDDNDNSVNETAGDGVHHSVVIFYVGKKRGNIAFCRPRMDIITETKFSIFAAGNVQQEKPHRLLFIIADFKRFISIGTAASQMERKHADTQ